MNSRRALLTGLLGIGIVGSGLMIAQHPPEQNVNPSKHPNIAAAQRFIEQAYNKITDAQQANEWDMNGHAAKAKDLLDQASHELKLAAEAANHHH